MIDVEVIKTYGKDLFLDTGSPHYVKIVESLDYFNVINEGKKIRNSNEFINNGVNVNFVKILSEREFEVRTYERGVEGETLSCGTGVTAVALAMFNSGKTDSKKVKIKTKGGELFVEFDTNGERYFDIKLTGDSPFTFS